MAMLVLMAVSVGRSPWRRAAVVNDLVYTAVVRFLAVVRVLSVV